MKGFTGGSVGIGFDGELLIEVDYRSKYPYSDYWTISDKERVAPRRLKRRIIKKWNARLRHQQAVESRRCRGDHLFWDRMGAWQEELHWQAAHPKEHAERTVRKLSTNSIYGKIGRTDNE